MTHTRHDLLKARLALVRRDLLPILDRLTPELLEWAPAEGMRTISGQIVEIVGTEIQLIALLKDNQSLSDPEARQLIGDYDSVDHLKHSLTVFRQQTIAYLDSLSEADLMEEITFKGGWFASLMLPTVPRAEIFLNIADHEWYHVGQLTSYLWQCGKNPYSW